jgi:radical SAM superfamily enzyme YgiQ (UPF0313 family)
MPKDNPSLLIIQPTHFRSRTDRRLFKTRRRAVVPLTLPYLAALTPAEWKVRLLDEQLESIDYDQPVDLVVLSAWTLHSRHAYEIAAEFRRRRVPVVMGGPHAFFYPEEASAHCDAIGVGEAEPIWRRMLDDAAAGHLEKIYRAEPTKDLAGLPLPRYDLLDLRRYGPFRTYAIQSSRGCPFRCNFCSERLYLGGKYRWRPVAEVVEEIRRSGGRNFLFGESNFGGDRARAMELMEALIPLRISWSSLWSSYLCLDTDFLALARRSGLLHINIGIESIDTETLVDMNKKMNKVSRYAEICRNLRQYGISYSLNFILGWDNEKPDVFDSTMRFLHQNKVPVAYFNVLTPTKGTVLFDRMLNENRIIDPEEIDRWPGQTCHIKPQHCSPDEMESRIQRMYKGFYNLRSMWSRLPLPTSKAALASWAINFSERRMALAARNNNDFDIY